MIAGVDIPPLALPVDEYAVTGDRCRAVLRVAHAVVDEPKALTRLDAERFGVVGHDGNARPQDQTPARPPSARVSGTHAIASRITGPKEL